MHPENSIDSLLHQWADGDTTAYHRLFTLVYGELKRIAHNELRNEPNDPLLQTTGLVHETFLRLRSSRVEWEDKQQFYALFARAMRQVLVDFGRRRNAVKRSKVPQGLTAYRNRLPADVLDLNDALDELEQLDPEKGRLVELRYFGGLSLEEVADVTGVSLATVKREWQTTRLWLLRKLKGNKA